MKEKTADQTMTIRDWQGYVSDWADAVFSTATIESTIKHLELELKELRAAHDATDRENIAEECADILGILLHYANQQGIDLGRALRDKMVINNNRRWNPPNEDGIMFHKKEEE